MWQKLAISSIYHYQEKHYYTNDYANLDFNRRSASKY